MFELIQPMIIVMLWLYILAAFGALLLYRHEKLANFIPGLLSSLAAMIGFITSLNILVSGEDRIYLGNFITSVPYISLEIGIDRLSAFFILALSILTFCVSIYSMGYLTHYTKRYPIWLFNFLFNTFILSMIAVLISVNLVGFLIAWELMSLISYFLVVFETETPESQKAGVTYIIMTHLATAFLVIAFGLIFKQTGSLATSSSLLEAPEWLKNLLFIFLLIGFGTKAGMIPFHIWLPYAHPAAPSNISALMSGMMIKVAIYGMIRFIFGMLGTEIQWWGTLLLIIGVISTLMGVAYTLIEQNLKKLLAYCSIENIGLILIGLGVSFLAGQAGEKIISALAFTAACFHLLNHTIAKGLLFLGAGSIHFSTHTKDIEGLGGLLKKMPWTGFFVLIGALAISAIPPLNGFMSEWLLYQSLFGYLLLAPFGFKVVLIITVAVLAMAGAFAAASFIKLFGISFLGLPRSESAVNTKEVPTSMLWGMGILAGLSVLLGIFPRVIVKLLDGLTLNVTGVSLSTQLTGGSWMIYYPLKVAKNEINPLIVLVLGIVMVLIIWAIVKILSRNTKERRYGTWDCGFTGLTSRMQYSATGFSKPFRIIYRAIYRPTRELKIEEGTSIYYHKAMKYEVTTESVFEKYLYFPLTNTFTHFARRVRLTVQTGSIHTYLIYIFVMIMALLVYFRLFS